MTHFRVENNRKHRRASVCCGSGSEKREMKNENYSERDTV